MKLPTSLVVLAPLLSSFVSQAWALPSFAKLDDRAQQDLIADMIKRDGHFDDAAVRRQFSRRQTKVPTIGLKKIPDADHPFIAPSKTAQRGPCPGLNVLANHGYLNREGITDFDELLYAQQEGMGWALDLSTFLAALAVAVDGNPLNGKVSIGGPDSRVGTIPILGSGTAPGGILSHDTYEIDSSLTRNDLALGGDNKNLNGTLYQQIWDVADEMNGGKINDQVMAVVRSNRYEASERDNPKFTFAPIGVLFFGADHFLWNTLVSSGKDGEPGPSTRETLSGTYGAKRTGERTWTYVPERFPEEWYRRARPLTIPEVVGTLVPSVALAAEKGQLPVGVTKASFASPQAFMCAIKTVALGQVPGSIRGLGAVAQLIKQMGGATC